MTPGSILAAVRAFLSIVGQVLGLVERRQIAVKVSEDEAAGAAKQSAAGAVKAEENRKEDERKKAEVAGRSDAQLDADYGRWVQ